MLRRTRPEDPRGGLRFQEVAVVQADAPTIRRLERDDVEAFREIRLRGLKEEPTAFAMSFDEEAAEDADVVAARLAPSADRLVLGAFLGDALVGVVGLAREAERKRRHVALLWGMYVIPEGRGEGVGRRLVEEALAEARGMDGVRQVNLSVNARNAPALSLYVAAGFAAFGVERAYLVVDGEEHDEVHMACDLRAP